MRRLELWLGATYEALDMLVDIYSDLIPRFVHDLEVRAGVEVMRELTYDILRTFTPVIEQYHESRQYGRSVAARLRDAAFPKVEETSDPFDALVALQSLHLFLSYIEGHLTALSTASQALWDTSFVEAVNSSQATIQRQQLWASKYIKVKGPQTLLVPNTAPNQLHARDSSLAGYLRE